MKIPNPTRRSTMTYRPFFVDGLRNPRRGPQGRSRVMFWKSWTADLCHFFLARSTNKLFSGASAILVAVGPATQEKARSIERTAPKSPPF